MNPKGITRRSFVRSFTTAIVIAIGFCVGCTSTPKPVDRSRVKEISDNAVKAPDQRFFLFRSNDKYAAVKFTQPIKKGNGGYEYVWYYQDDQSGRFTNPNTVSGKGEVYEKLVKPDGTSKKKLLTPDEISLDDLDDGETFHIKCVDFRVEWSMGLWVYLWDDTIQIALTPFSNIEDVDCFDSNLTWIKRKPN